MAEGVGKVQRSRGGRGERGGEPGVEAGRWLGLVSEPG